MRRISWLALACVLLSTGCGRRAEQRTLEESGSRIAKALSPNDGAVKVSVEACTATIAFAATDAARSRYVGVYQINGRQIDGIVSVEQDRSGVILTGDISRAVVSGQGGNAGSVGEVGLPFPTKAEADAAADAWHTWSRRCGSRPQTRGWPDYESRARSALRRIDEHKDWFNGASQGAAFGWRMFGANSCAARLTYDLRVSADYQSVERNDIVEVSLDLTKMKSARVCCIRRYGASAIHLGTVSDGIHLWVQGEADSEKRAIPIGAADSDALLFVDSDEHAREFAKNWREATDLCTAENVALEYDATKGNAVVDDCESIRARYAQMEKEDGARIAAARRAEQAKETAELRSECLDDRRAKWEEMRREACTMYAKMTGEMLHPADGFTFPAPTP